MRSIPNTPEATELRVFISRTLGGARYAPAAASVGRPQNFPRHQIGVVEAAATIVATIVRALYMICACFVHRGGGSDELFGPACPRRILLCFASWCTDRSGLARLAGLDSLGRAGYTFSCIDRGRNPVSCEPMGGGGILAHARAFHTRASAREHALARAHAQFHRCDHTCAQPHMRSH